MITYIKIDGFKSFQNFEIEFTPLTVIAGTNASGKSNLFDALKLLSNLAESDKIQTAFRKEQRGEMYELFTQYNENTYASEMDFAVEMLVNKDIRDDWGGEATLKYTRLRYELKIQRLINETGMETFKVVHEKLVNLKHQEDKWIKTISQNRDFWRPKVSAGKRGIPYIYTDVIEGKPTVIVPQDGVKGGRMHLLENATRTVLSSVDSVDFRHVLAAKEEMKSWRFLQLNPKDLRQPTSKRTGEDVISSSGQNLAASLFRICKDDNSSLLEISRKLNNIFPNFTEVLIKDDDENKQYILSLKDINGIEYTSRVLSDGTLRLLALLVLEQDIKCAGLLCFEEPENGIHPFKIKAIVELLKNLTTNFADTEIPLRQVIANTHSSHFVYEMYNKLSQDKNTSIQFTQTVDRIVQIESNKKCKLQVSRVMPVKLDIELPFAMSEQDEKIPVSILAEYLNTKKGALL